MRQKTSSEKVVKYIRRTTRRRFSAEEKIRNVLDGLRGEGTIAELCRRVEHWAKVLREPVGDLRKNVEEIEQMIRIEGSLIEIDVKAL